jgi:hypothetical protein
MSAIAALKAARAAGLQLRVEGSDLVLEASAPPPSTVLSLLSLKGRLIACTVLGLTEQINFQGVQIGQKLDQVLRPRT